MRAKITRLGNAAAPNCSSKRIKRPAAAVAVEGEAVSGTIPHRLMGIVSSTLLAVAYYIKNVAVGVPSGSEKLQEYRNKVAGCRLTVKLALCPENNAHKKWCE